MALVQLRSKIGIFTSDHSSKGNYTSSANQPPPVTASPEAKIKYENRKVETEIEQLHLANQK